MSITLHVLNADGRLSGIESAAKAAFAQALPRIQALLPIDGVDVLLCGEPGSTVPELGLGGYSPSGSRCFLFIDPAHPTLHESLPLRFTSFLAHELHHCLRWRGPGYGSSLGEALISEGLACHFEAEVTPGALPLYAALLPANEMATVRMLAQAEAALSEYDHSRWFYGTGNLPQWAGYALGTSMVGAYLNTYKTTAASLARMRLTDHVGVANAP